MSFIIAEKFHPEWKSLQKFLQTSGNSLYSCPTCVVVKFGSQSGMRMQREHGPFPSWTTLPRLFRYSFLLSSKKPLNLLHSFFHQPHWKSQMQIDNVLLLHISPETRVGPCLAPVTTSISFHFRLDWWKALNSQLKFISLISFSVHVLFPCNLKVR